MTKCYKISSLYTPYGTIKDIDIVVNEQGIILNKGKNLKGDEIVELKGFVFPTLVNAHTHLELTNINMDEKENILWDWILNIIQKKRSLKDKDFIASIEAGENRFLEQGIYCLGDVRSVLPEGPYFLNKNISGKIFFEVLGYTEDLFLQKMEALKTFLDMFNGKKGISLHSLYTTSFTKALTILSLAKQKRLQVMMHIGETIYETELFFKNEFSGFNKIFPRIDFQRLGVESYGGIIEKLDLNSETILVHCVEFKKTDWDVVKKREICVVLCPRSNLYWSNKLPDFNYILEKDIPFALGTDSPATNNVLDILDDAKILLDLAKNKRIGIKKIFYALTYGGRNILKIKETGLDVGNRINYLFVPEIYQEEDFLDYFFTEKKVENRY